MASKFEVRQQQLPKECENETGRWLLDSFKRLGVVADAHLINSRAEKILAEIGSKGFIAQEL